MNPRGCPRLMLVVLASAVLGHRDAEAEPRSQACEKGSTVSWRPHRPVPGSLFSVRIDRRANGTRPEGFVAGERLHFSAGRDGVWRSLAAAPIDSTRSLALRVTCADSPSDTVKRAISLASMAYPLERLRVAPEFSAAPDSALAARLRKEADRSRAVSVASHDTPRLWEAPFSPPRASRITSGFGRGREFNGTVTSRHMGTDYAGVVGAPVRAANRGVVRLVDRFFLGGNVIYIDHGEGLVTAYLHLSQQRAAERDTVERGDVIGLVGATGRVTGPHLHFIARFGGVTVDPASLMRVSAQAYPPP